MTRGTDHASKLSDPKREKWTLMEMESGIEFHKFRKSVDFNPISQKMAELNETSGHVCFNRFQALGDVVLVTGPLREYKEAHPDHKIYVRTQHPEVFQNNPHIEKILGIEEVFVGRVIELDMAYENEPALSILQAYADKSGVDPEKCSPELFLKYDTRETLYSKFPDLEKEPYVVFHQGGGWRSKSFDGLFWLKLAHEVKKTGRRIVLVGKKERDICGIGMSGVTDLVGLLNLHELAWLCKGADLFIGPDSAPLHVSESTGTPSIGLYTCTDPFMTHYKPENYVITESTCRGCKHRQAPGLTWLECPDNRDYKCVRDFPVDKVMDKEKELL
jgi:ADP-heptose:LPS heptosyltransferase